MKAFLPKTGIFTVVFLIANLFFFTNAFGANRYAVANGLWNSTATWSATDGGSSGASVPSASDCSFYFTRL